MGLQGIHVLILGDIVTLALVTVAGFASHHELASAGWRMLTTFLPLVIAWLAIAPHLRLFEMESVRDVRQLWRPVWGMILAGPLAAWLRGLWLKTPILPLFVLVLSGISALALVAWRILFRIWLRGIFHG